jgi:F-type H+-transporting ATPase subunit beta
VLLEELRRSLKQTKVGLHVFGLVAPSDSGNYRDWPPEGAMADRAGDLLTYWILADSATDPAFTALGAFDCVHYCSPLLAMQGLYPAIDPEYSHSKLLTEQIAAPEHVELAVRARALLTEAKRKFCAPTAVELWASCARASAAQVAREYEPETKEPDALRLSRARKLQFFMTQPFHVASEHTGWTGRAVSLRDTLQGCREILNGEVDDLPAEAFRYVGTIDEARELAKTGTFRRY